MTQPLFSPVDRLRAALHAALRFLRHETPPASAGDARLVRVRRVPESVTLQIRESVSTHASEALSDEKSVMRGAQHADAARPQLDLLAEEPAERSAEPGGSEPVAHDPATHAVLGAELEAAKARVRERRVRIGARVAAQRKSAHHVESRAQRLEERLDKVRERRKQLLEVDLGIARTDVALVASQVELEEAIAQLTACERELNRCTTQCVLLREHGADAAAVHQSAHRCVERTRAKLKQLYEHGRATRTLDLIACADETSGGVTLLATIDRWRAQTDQLADLLARAAAPDTAESPGPRLASPALRVQLDTRLRILVALGEIRVEETEALHAALAGDSSRSRAVFARLSGARIGLLLDGAQRAWLLETLAAATHEQSARLPPTMPDAAGATALQRAADAWRSCERKLEEAASQTRSVSRDLAALRGALGPALASADAELRELGAQMRHRQRALRSRVRQSARARSRLQLTRKRCSALEAGLQRARATLECAHARVEPAALASLLTRLFAFEREVEAGVAALAGLHAAHDRSTHAMLAMERALLELGRVKRTPAEPVIADAMPGVSPERIEEDIATLTKEIEHWKASHTQLERRVDAQAGRLASLETGRQEDAALAELRLELEHAGTCAVASLQRALALNPESVEPESASGPAPRD